MHMGESPYLISVYSALVIPFSDPYYSLLQYISYTRNRLKRLVVLFSLCTEEIEVQIVEGTCLCVFASGAWTSHQDFTRSA